jgi:hypothetical protein
MLNSHQFFTANSASLEAPIEQSEAKIKKQTLEIE